VFCIFVYLFNSAIYIQSSSLQPSAPLHRHSCLNLSYKYILFSHAYFTHALLCYKFQLIFTLLLGWKLTLYVLKLPGHRRVFTKLLKKSVQDIPCLFVLCKLVELNIRSSDDSVYTRVLRPVQCAHTLYTLCTHTVDTMVDTVYLHRAASSRAC
jgi:hypothetical protein